MQTPFLAGHQVPSYPLYNYLILPDNLPRLLYVVSVPVGNKFLCRPPPTWTSEQPITQGQLLSKRDDFWETSPLYGGKAEIWQVTVRMQQPSRF